jgi:hypothetical protein
MESLNANWKVIGTRGFKGDSAVFYQIKFIGRFPLAEDNLSRFETDFVGAPAEDFQVLDFHVLEERVINDAGTNGFHILPFLFQLQLSFRPLTKLAIACALLDIFCYSLLV